MVSEDQEKKFRSEEEERRLRRNKADNAIIQARVRFSEELRQREESWDDVEKEALQGLLKPFNGEDLYVTIGHAVLESMRESSSCLLAKFSVDEYGEKVAERAAHEAAFLVRQAEQKAQVRREGNVFLVKLLDV